MKPLYDKTELKKNELLYPKKAMIALLIPAVVEQLLNSAMGMVDSVMVSNVGSEAISAVSLVDTVNTLIIQVFSAMATGAAIICSHYLGAGDKKSANEAARQIFLTVLVISCGLMAIGLAVQNPLLMLIFGDIEEDVMEKSQQYFLFSLLSYPFIALFSMGSAFFRSGGNSKFPMRISILSNVINVGGNAILIFACGLGVRGAALATLLSRAFCAVVIMAALRQPKQDIVLTGYFKIHPDFKIIGKVLSIGIPAGVENGMFQFGKLAIQSTVSTLGTAAIAAQAMTNIFENLNGVFGGGVGIALMTMVGQAIGAGRKEEAKYYVVKNVEISIIGIAASCLLVWGISKPVMWLASMEEESAALCYAMLTAITIYKPLVWSFSFTLPAGMRSAGDVKFTMIVSTITMWTVRVASCIVLIRVFGLGPMAVWYAMFADWTIRGIIFMIRFRSERWLGKKVI